MYRGDDLPTFPTLAGCFRPVEEYARLVKAATGKPQPARVPLRAVDAYLMHQVAAFLPSRPAVIDFAGAATGGASTIFWWSDAGIDRLIPAEVAGEDTDWKRLPAAGGERLGLDPTRVYPPDWVVADQKSKKEARRKNRKKHSDSIFAALVPPLAPVVVSVAVPEDDVARLGELLAWAFDAFANPVVLVAPVGRIGNSGVLDECLAACHGGGRRLALLRDVSPFLATSQLALIFAADDGRVPDVLSRIGSAFEGNFQFLDLVRHACESDATIAGLEKRLAEASAHIARPARARLDYPALIRRVQQAVAANLPSQCVVAVVSRGDDMLLDLGTRTAWHFPRTADGTYVGHHPANGDAAIAHLKHLREDGADFLLFPATAFWWLDHYADFNDHLARNCTEIYRADDTGVIFALSQEAKADALEYRCRLLADELCRLRGESPGSGSGRLDEATERGSADPLSPQLNGTSEHPLTPDCPPCSP